MHDADSLVRATVRACNTKIPAPATTMPSSSTVFEDQRGSRSVACRNLFRHRNASFRGRLAALRGPWPGKRILAGGPQRSASSRPGFVSPIHPYHPSTFPLAPDLSEGARGKVVLHHRYKAEGERKVRVFNEPNRPALREDTVRSSQVPQALVGYEILRSQQARRYVEKHAEKRSAENVVNA